MKISKKDAYKWFKFFASLPEDEQLMAKQQEIVYSTFAQIEEVIDKRDAELMADIKVLKHCRTGHIMSVMTISFLTAANHVFWVQD